MNFAEAMKELQAGKKVSRSSWGNGQYFVLSGGTVTVGDEVLCFQSHYRPYLYDSSIMISKGWIVEGVDGEHDFSSLMTLLQQGLHARLKNWDNSYIFLDSATKEIVLRGVSSQRFSPIFSDFIATDWMVLE